MFTPVIYLLDQTALFVTRSNSPKNRKLVAVKIKEVTVKDKVTGKDNEGMMKSSVALTFYPEDLPSTTHLFPVVWFLPSPEIFPNLK